MDTNKFDPNGVGLENSGIFGLPYSPEESQVVLIPAPWSVTVSYGGGTHDGPKAVLDASPQIDYFHPSYGADSWKVGVSMLPIGDWNDAYEEGLSLREKAKAHIEALESGEITDDRHTMSVINEACEKFHERIEMTASELLDKGKLVGLVGGDHSTPLGLMRALAKKHEHFGILQIDAHCDLRDSYEGFNYSHASIMHNTLKMPQVQKLVQVGIRDYSIGEKETIDNSGGRIQTFFDPDLKSRQFKGETWHTIVHDIVAALPDSVYISFDIDGLDPALCPGTGTPVPGGLPFSEATYLIQAIAESGKRIIGFDLNEVSPRANNDSSYYAKASKDEWDANVGMRILWNIALWAARSNNVSFLKI